MNELVVSGFVVYSNGGNWVDEVWCLLFCCDVCASKGKVPELFLAGSWGGEAGLHAAVGEVFDPVWASFRSCGLDVFSVSVMLSRASGEH